MAGTLPLPQSIWLSSGTPSVLRRLDLLELGELHIDEELPFGGGRYCKVISFVSELTALLQKCRPASARSSSDSFENFWAITRHLTVTTLSRQNLVGARSIRMFWKWLANHSWELHPSEQWEGSAGDAFEVQADNQ